MRQYVLGVPVAPYRYQSHDEDSARWTDFRFRDGDIVISTRSKSGTTWMQMICALLIFQTAELPARLTELSPWLDWLGTPRDQVVAQLDAQTHRRFIKTHTPLDGIPIDPRAAYIVVARHPLDAAMSAYHQGANLDRARLAELTGNPSPAQPAERPSAHDWLVDWIAADVDPRDHLDSLPGIGHHLTDAWARRDEPNIVLVHYDDLINDLEREMRGLADRLGITVPSARWPALIEGAGFDHMRSRAEELAPDPANILIDRDRFFRGGRSGGGRGLLTPGELETYEAHMAALVAPDLLAWLHR